MIALAAICTLSAGVISAYLEPVSVCCFSAHCGHGRIHSEGAFGPRVR